ncbi:hypothetical protein GS597_17810 [Synechococcales cyanobacterium C]|uniref:Uncharacterized protein n=1 Tax=Petrachloros mirabilis ULC683 TaxID=2781853 RepID=A0A8K2A0Q0_9CYAN|nr:hypothetical protein [Petrachloros mirabilis]NCJ08328.1 hypothetical protein [Petrachloros mirabilis ULC683]
MSPRLNLQCETAIAPDSQISGWDAVCHITYTRDTWVKLLRAPSEYAAAEAKLLCQESPNTWVVWVPGYGEIVLDRSYFYC